MANATPTLLASIAAANPGTPDRVIAVAARFVSEFGDRAEQALTHADHLPDYSTCVDAKWAIRAWREAEADPVARKVA